MPLKAILDDLKVKKKKKIIFAVIFVRKFPNHFLKVQWNPVFWGGYFVIAAYFTVRLDGLLVQAHF